MNPGMRVMLIDDEPELVLLWRDYLTARGHDVRVAHRVSEVAQLLEHGDTEVAVVDFQLPDGTAADVLDLLQAHAPTTRTVLCSGHGTHLPPELVQRAAATIGKPLRLDALCRAIEGD